jgi:hypothetical protein
MQQYHGITLLRHRDTTRRSDRRLPTATAFDGIAAGGQRDAPKNRAEAFVLLGVSSVLMP